MCLLKYGKLNSYRVWGKSKTVAFSSYELANVARHTILEDTGVKTTLSWN